MITTTKNINKIKLSLSENFFNVNINILQTITCVSALFLAILLPTLPKFLSLSLLVHLAYACQVVLSVDTLPAKIHYHKA